MDYIIRKIKREDCFQVAHIVTIVWNETYKGIVTDNFLDKLYQSEEDRGKKSFEKFNEKENHQYVLEINNKIVGFINVGSCNENELTDCGEIYAIYIIKDYQGYGLGKKLIDIGIKELKTMGYNKMVIGCLKGNPTNEFYKHIGGKYIKTRIFEKLQLPENLYYFDKI